MSAYRLSHEETVALVRKAQSGESSAEDQLVKANTGLVKTIARKAWPRARGGLELDDLISEGFIGLIVAIRKFQPERGNRLSTVATWWIWQSVQRAIDSQASLVRIPTCATKRGVAPLQLVSLDIATGENGDVLADLLQASDDTEGEVVSKVACEETLARLEDDERRLVLALMEGCESSEIAEREGVRVQVVSRRRRKLKVAIAAELECAAG
jgi:RNA polymerase sigma factor (sigma-70 family)